jgi:hypothetical protein
MSTLQKSASITSSSVPSAPDASPLLAAKAESTSIEMPLQKPEVVKPKTSKRKKICWSVCGLLLVILIVLGVIVGLYFPRVGGVTATRQPYWKENVSTIKTSGHMYNASEANPYTVTFLAFLDVNVTMNNVVDINLDKVTVSVSVFSHS